MFFSLGTSAYIHLTRQTKTVSAFILYKTSLCITFSTTIPKDSNVLELNSAASLQLSAINHNVLMNLSISTRKCQVIREYSKTHESLFNGAELLRWRLVPPGIHCGVSEGHAPR